MDDKTQAQAGEVERLAQAAKLGPFTAAEQELLKQAPTGDWAKCGPSYDDKDNDPKEAAKWGKDRQIRAELVAWLCTNEPARKKIHTRGIQVYGADMVGPLALSFVKIPFPLTFEHCRVREDMDLSRVEVAELNLSGSVVRGITAEGVVVKNSVFLNNGFAANGEVLLSGAQIGGHLVCTAGRLMNEGGMAIRADGANITGDVNLHNGFIANGEVLLSGAQIAGNLNCQAGTFLNQIGNALRADRVNVKGSVLIGRGSEAAWTETPFNAKGKVNLDLAQIGGQLACVGGVFSDPAGNSLSAERAVVKSSVLLSDGFNADGRVNLVGAQIGGDFICSGGNFQNATLDMSDASVATLFDSGLNDPVDLNPTIWPPGENDHYLYLDGFTYGRISSYGQIDVKRRLDWLARQPQSPFHPQPYLQLAKVLRESGDDKGAQKVLIEMEGRSRKGSIWSPVLKYTIGYGYDPIRAFWWATGLAGLGWIIYRRSYLAGGMVPTDKDACAKFRETDAQVPGHYPSFSPLVYSVENSLPLVKLGQGDKWQPDPEPAHQPENQLAPKLGYRGDWLWRTPKPVADGKAPDSNDASTAKQQPGAATTQETTPISTGDGTAVAPAPILEPPPISRRHFFAPLDRVFIAVGLRPSTDVNHTPSFASRFGTSPRFVTWFRWFQILLGWLLATLFLAGVSGIVHK